METERMGEAREPVSILLVDDEARNLDVLESILGQLDYRLVRAQTADEALMALLAGDFAAIVLDIRMPGTSGIELAQLIKQRKRTRDVPIVFLTAHLSDERDVLRGYDVGAVDYLTKPVNPDILRSKIAVFVDLFRKTRALAAANVALEKEVHERQRAEEALREANEELEARVQERTADLTRAFEEKRQLLESERAARSEAERASRLKDEFLAIVSHELRTPLNAILGWAHILTQSRVERPEILAQGLDTIVRNARAQANLIEDLLDMSRIVSGKIRLNLRAVALPEIVTAAVETITPAAQAKGIRIDCALDGSDRRIHGDSERLQQIVLNLLSNAVKFTPEGGRVEVFVEAGDAWAEVAVRDTGEGIRPDFLPNVFAPFSQADSSTTRRHGGLGLGLAVVSHLVELHGGTVRAESPGPGLGSTFAFRIPDRSDGEAPVEKSDGDLDSTGVGLSVSVGVDGLSGLRLLVVEDEPDTRDALTRFLQHYGAAVTAVASAGEALQRLGAEDFDVLVSDIGMPEMDGYDLIRELRRRETAGRDSRCLPAVAVTAFSREEDRQRVLEEGYHEHVSKPVNTTRLIGVLLELAGRTA
ncbi:MAG TPA: response regulator [Thermoanaerobaculia bacterium]|jgi:signal transduction histidine kinase|nr:response regulator [Thermoanaerobaculia bacterium]